MPAEFDGLGETNLLIMGRQIDAIFLRRDLLPEDAVLPSLESLTRWDWPEDSYREPPAPPGRGWVSV